MKSKNSPHQQVYNISRKHFRLIRQSNRGETIVETMIAFVICLIFLASISGLITTSLSLISRATIEAKNVQDNIINPLIHRDYSGFGDNLEQITIQFSQSNAQEGVSTLDDVLVDVTFVNEKVQAFTPTLPK